MDIRVKVIPKSSKTELTGYLPDGTWKIKVAAAPEKGKANRALMRFPRGEAGRGEVGIRIVSGKRRNSNGFTWTNDRAVAAHRQKRDAGGERGERNPLRVGKPEMQALLVEAEKLDHEAGRWNRAPDTSPGWRRPRAACRSCE